MCYGTINFGLIEIESQLYWNYNTLHIGERFLIKNRRIYYIWPFNEQENLHLDNEKKINMNSKN